MERAGVDDDMRPVRFECLAYRVAIGHLDLSVRQRYERAEPVAPGAHDVRPELPVGANEDRRGAGLTADSGQLTAP